MKKFHLNLLFSFLCMVLWQVNTSAQDPCNLPPAGFAASCPAGTAPIMAISEDFEGGLGIFTQSAADDLNWTVDANGTTSFATGPAGDACPNPATPAANPGNYLYIESSFPAAFGDEAAVTANLDLTGLAAGNPAVLSFYTHMFGSCIGNLTVSINGGAPALTITGQQQGSSAAAWTQQSVDLTAFSGQNISIEIRGAISAAGCGSSFDSDIAIDNIAVFTCGIPCTLTCGPAIVVSNDLGVCGANVTVPNPVATGPCSSTMTIFSEDFDAGVLPAGWMNAGIGANPAALWMFGANNNTPGGEIDGTGMAFFHDDDFDGDGGDIAQMTTSVIDLSSVTAPMLSFDYIFEDLGASFFLVEYSDDNGGTWNTVLNENTDPGCFGFDDAGCAPRTVTNFPLPASATTLLRFTYDDGNGWNWYAAVDNIEITDVAPVTITNDFNGTTDASGDFPVGTTTVTFTTLDENGNPVSCSVDVTVNDDEAPTLDCPGDMTIHLDPGACDQVLSFDVTATDNCTITGAPLTLTTNNDPAGTTGGLQCAAGQPVSVLQIYDIDALGVTEEFTTSGIDVFLSTNSGPSALTANIYTIAAAPAAGTGFNYTDLTLLGTNTITYSNIFGFSVPGVLVNVPVTATVTPGTLVVIEVVANPTGTTAFSNNTAGLTSGTGQSFITCPTLGFPNPISFQQVPNPVFGTFDAVLSLNGNFPALPVQTAGLPSGSAFPIGTTTNTFEATDDNGNVGTCTWSVTIVEFVPTSNDITCNDLVHITLDDEDCTAVVGADQILEGNNYGCYDNFTVTFADSGLPVVLDGDDVGQTYEVMVTNPNGNPCWGFILVEDKTIPDLICEDVTITCDTPTDPGTAFSSTTTEAFPTVATVDNSTQSSTVTVGGIGELDDLDVAISSTHTWVGDLTITVTSPAGTSVELIARPGLAGNPPFGCNNAVGQNMDVVLDDEATATYADFDAQCPAVGTFQPANPLSAFDGESINGDWTVEVNDAVGGDFGDVNVELSIASSGSVPFPVPAGVTVIPAGPNTWTLLGFDPCGTATLTSSDVESGDLCAGTAQIERTWTATDESGNSTSCVQIITITPTTLADVVADLPADITLECGDALPAPLTDIGCSNIGITLASEVTIDICEGSYKLLRNYILVDWCDNSTLEYLQIIKVLDTEGPTIAPIAALTAGTSSNDCSGNILLPAASATDCGTASDNIDFEYSASQGDIIGNTLQNLPLGVTILTITATDDCGNSSSIDVEVTISDDIAPIAICDEHTIVSIGSDGTAAINATTFDDGSYDNCGIVEMLARRMDNPACPGFDGSPFATSVPFYCCDVNTTVMVEFRVRDAAGNINSCMVEVEVQDKLAPTIICPADKDVECSETYLDYIVLNQPLPQDAIDANGAALATDNCPGVTVTNNVIGNTVDCGNGVITIVWTATDAVGLTSSCIQRYFVSNNDPFFINANNDLDPTDDVVWPLDYTATTCGTGLDPEDLSSPYNYPVVDEGACNNVAIGHHDQVLDFGAGDACLKILRKWYIIDWCQAIDNQDPTQPGPGVWHYTQIIKVINSNDPNVTVVNFPSVIDNFDADCGSVFAAFEITVDDDCTPQDDIQVSWEFSTGLSGTGLSASGAFVNGSYSLTFTVSDGCGNTVWEIHDFTVVDAKKPTPVCIFGIATTVMPSSGAVTIWASDFESGSSYDNCTIYDNLLFSFSQDITQDNITIECADIPADGLYPITLYVTDETGNFDFCSTFINVQDPNGACAGPTSLITGTIENENQEVVEEVTVTLSDDAGMNLPVVTGADGVYEFNMTTGDYDVTPEKDINYLNGVTTYDLVLISKHILGTQLLDSPYKVIAADANNTQSVTTLDIVKLRALILHIDDELANNTSWRFVDANHVFGTNVFDFPEFISLDGSVAPANFTAIKVGDVNGTATPNNLLGSDSRTFDGNLALSLEATEVAAGETFTVDFKANDFKNIAGYQFTLGFGHSVEFVDVASNLEGLSTKNFGLTKLNEGVITTSWNSNEGVTVANGEVLFSMTFRANAAVNTQDLLSINSRYTESEAYNGSDLYNVVLEFNGTTVSNGFELFQNTPNPFKAETTIGFNMPQAGAVTLKIYDVSGRVLRLIEMDAVKGANSVNVTREGIDATGVLYYQLETATETATKKMILVD